MIDLRRYRANTQRRFGEASHYHFIRHAGRWLALTDTGLLEARVRAEKNREDQPTLSAWQRFCEWVAEWV